MTRAILLLGAGWLALAGIAGFQVHEVQVRQARLQGAREQAQQLEAKAGALRTENEAASHERAQAEQQLAALIAAKPDATLSPARQTEISQWLQRTKRLHEIFTERSDQRIAEMQLLQDEDWLRAAKEADFASEDTTRKALAEIRDAATRRYIAQLSSALKAFAQSAAPGSAPTIQWLAPFLEPGVDASLLDRYELRSKTSGRLGGSVEWSICNKAPLDSLYDSRFESNASNIGGSGTGTSFAPAAWIPDFPERLQRATVEYRRAHQNANPPGIADVLQLFSPALDPVVVERMIAAERERAR